MDIYRTIEVLEITKEFYNIKRTASSIAIDIAIQNLRKDIPKMVIREAWNPDICPTCGNELSESLGDGYYTHPTFLKRCTNVECGQRLKWSDDE